MCVQEGGEGPQELPGGGSHLRRVDSCGIKLGARCCWDLNLNGEWHLWDGERNLVQVTRKLCLKPPVCYLQLEGAGDERAGVVPQAWAPP